MIPIGFRAKVAHKDNGELDLPQGILDAVTPSLRPCPAHLLGRGETWTVLPSRETHPKFHEAGYRIVKGKDWHPYDTGVWFTEGVLDSTLITC